MNRAHRRAAQRRTTRDITTAAQRYAQTHGPCPDCNADLTITEHTPGVIGINIAHDDTCPWLAQHERNRT